MGLPKLALILGAAAADKPGASLEPDTTLSTTAAPTSVGLCCQWSSASDWCGTCDNGWYPISDWCSYSRSNCETGVSNCGGKWCGDSDVSPQAPSPAPTPAPQPAPQPQPGQELGFVGCCFDAPSTDTCGACTTTIIESDPCFWNRANCEGCADHATWCGAADVMPWAPTPAPAALTSSGS